MLDLNKSCDISSHKNLFQRPPKGTIRRRHAYRICKCKRTGACGLKVRALVSPFYSISDEIEGNTTGNAL